MKKIFFTAALLICGVCFCQTNSEIIDDIRKDVWVPFIESYQNFDSEKLMGIHSDDIIRVNIDHNSIELGESYLKAFGGFLQHIKQKNSQVAIAFSIRSTAITEDKTMVYQTGYYQYSLKKSDEATLSVKGYGYFNVGLKKINGIWKIFLDSDKKAAITPEEFKAEGLIYQL